MEAPLSSAFAAGLGRPHAVDEARLARLVDEAEGGTTARVERTDFARWLGARVGKLAEAAPEGSGSVDCALDALHSSDLYLACACAARSPRALAELEARFHDRIAQFVARVDADPAFADEVRQILLTRLFVGATPSATGKIADYSGRGPLEGWLRVAALRIAIDLARSRRRDESLGGDDGSDGRLLSPGGDPELDYIKTRYRDDFTAAFGESLRALPSVERNVLRYYFVDGLVLEKIGALYQVNRSTVLRWIAGAREQLVVDLRRRLGERLSLGREELDSLMALVRSRVEVSLGGLLRSQP